MGIHPFHDANEISVSNHVKRMAVFYNNNSELFPTLLLIENIGSARTFNHNLPPLDMYTSCNMF